MTNEVFFDANYAVALVVRADEHHPTAKALAEEIARRGTRIVTTYAVMLEIGNSLAKQKHRSAAVGILDYLVADPTVEIVPFTTDLYSKSIRLYAERTDKNWGLTDCMSFIVMRERNITDALTFDRHFEQAGFNALLRRR